MVAPVIPPIVMDANTITTISNNLNSLYSNAISQLTAYTLGVVALVGILIPVLVTLIQWRSLKAEKDNLEAHISDEIQKAKSIIRDELVAEIKQLAASEEKKLISRMEERFKVLDNKFKCSEASTFHIQGNSNIRTNNYLSATTDFCIATEGYLSGGDALNGQRTLNGLIKNCIPKLNKTNFEENSDLETRINQTVGFLGTINDSNLYTDRIAELKKETKSAKVREPVAPPTK